VVADPSTEPTSTIAPTTQAAPGSTQAAPGAEPARGGRPAGRSGHGLRDMVISMAVLVVAILGLAAITHSFTFSPGGPSTSGATVPSVDPSQQYQLAVGQVHFPLRQPKLPAGWQANSADLDQVAGANTIGNQPNDVRVGWITPTGHYLALAESSAAAADLARQEAGLPADTQMTVEGQVQVGTHQWVIYSGTRSEQSWVLDLGSVRLLVTGNGSQAEFVTMAEAVQSAPVIPAA
jgi:hypothetical protein